MDGCYKLSFKRRLPKFMDKSFMHQSLQMLHCPQCGNLYTNSEVGVLQESDMAVLATITCSKCHHQSIVTLSMGNNINMNLPTDLRPIEIGKFLQSEPLDTNDLLDIYQYLKKTKGNFNEEFKSLEPTKTKVSKKAK
jgi:hypothetical protein